MVRVHRNDAVRVRSWPGELTAGTRFLLGSLPVDDWTEDQADAAFEEISRRVLALAEVEDDAAKVAEGKGIVKMIYEAEARCQWSGIAGEGAA